MPHFEFTPAEAATLANACLAATAAGRARRPAGHAVTVSTVNKAIEEKIVPVRLARDGHPRRYVSDAAITYVAASRVVDVSLSKTAKRLIYQTLAERMDEARKSDRAIDGIVKLSPYLFMDLGNDLPEWTRIVHAYARARADHIEENPEIMGGMPVVKGTRVPVHSLLAMVEGGDSVTSIARDFPQLSDEAIEAAVLYARSHPRLGRPKQFR